LQTLIGSQLKIIDGEKADERTSFKWRFSSRIIAWEIFASTSRCLERTASDERIEVYLEGTELQKEWLSLPCSSSFRIVDCSSLLVDSLPSFLLIHFLPLLVSNKQPDRQARRISTLNISSDLQQLSLSNGDKARVDNAEVPPSLCHPFEWL
jgi:hypothetical protein